MSDYQMIFHTESGVVGHFSVEIKGPGGQRLVKGFQPKNLLAKVKSTSLSPVQGDVKYDEDRLKDFASSIKSSKPIPLTKEQHDRVNGFLDKPGGEWKKYDANDRNCVDFANEAVKVAGLKGDVDDYLTHEQRGQMAGSAGNDGLEHTAESRKLLAELTKVDHPAEDILYKKPETWTEDEMKQVKKFRFSLTPSDPRFEDIAQRENAWFRHVYTDNPAKPDATGRINEPQPVNPIPKKAAPVKDADGIDFMSGLKRINKRIAHAAKMSGGTSPAVKSFQRGLNMTAQAGADAKDTPSFHTLKEDGVLGAKTRNAVKRTMADQGTAHAENALALGQLHDYAQNNDKRGFADLAKTTKSAFGPLFHDPAKPLAEKAPRYESVALQEAVNDMGKKQFGADKWQPLKTDGWIGPKTNNAFSHVAKAVDPHSLTERLGCFLGFA